MTEGNRRIRSVAVCLAIVGLASCGAIISFKNNLSASTKIKSIATTSGEISLVEGQREYTLSVPAGDDSIQIRVVLEEAASRLSIGGLPCASGQWSPSLTIKKGHKLSIPIVVGTGASPGAAENSATYTLTVDPEKTWSKPEPLVPYSEGVNQVNPQIVENDAGHTVAVWWQQPSSGSMWDLVASERDDGGEWTFPTILRQGISSPYDYKMKINNSGDVLLVWIDASTPGLRATLKRNGRWFDEEEIKTFEYIGNVVDIHQFGCHLDDIGNAIVVWTNKNCDGVMKSALFCGETSWTSNSIVNDISTPGIYSYVAIDLNEVGQGYIVWIRQNTSGSRLYAKSYSFFSDSLGNEYGPLDIQSINNNRNPKVYINNNCEAVVVWEDATNQCLTTSHLPIDSNNPQDNIQIPSVGKCSFLKENASVMQVLSENNLFVIWHEKRTVAGNSVYDLFGTTSNMLNWTAPIQLTNEYSYNYLSPSIAQNGLGQAVITYKYRLSDNTDKIAYRVLDGSIQSEHNITVPYEKLDYPCASMDIDGNVTCLWSQVPASGGSSKIMVDYYR